jgi:hypothetical protein
MSGSSNLVDYAQPLIRLEQLAREIHELCLSRSYREARKKCAEGMTEYRILAVSLDIMRENARDE